MGNALEVVKNSSDIGNALAEITTDSIPTSIKEVKELAKATANGICQKFEGLYELLEYSKELNNQARDAKTDMRKYFTLGLAGKSATQKRAELNTEAQTLQNQFNYEMLNLMQATLAFSILSARLSEAMIDEMEQCLKQGFTDVNGRIKKLSEHSAKQAKLLIQQIENSKPKEADKSSFGIAKIVLWLIFIAIIVGVLGYFGKMFFKQEALQSETKTAESVAIPTKTAESALNSTQTLALIDSQEAQKYSQKAYESYKIKEYSVALEWYMKALEANPNDAQNYSNVAITQYRLGNLDEALQYNKQAIKLANGENANTIIASSYYNIGKIYEDKGDSKMALDNYRNAFRFNANPIYSTAIDRVMASE